MRSSDLAFALELADLADELALTSFRSADLVVETKPDSTPVTEADRRIEEALRERISLERAGEGVLGEEFGDDGAATRWILDPIDGTRNYVRGIPVFATLIALEWSGEITVGVVSAPALRERWWAAKGEGAHANGTRIGVSRIERLEDAVFLYSSARTLDRQGRGRAFLELAARSWFARGFGEFWQHMLVAEGRAEFAVEPKVEVWDLAPLKLIVEEAGGRFTDFEGVARIDGGSAVSSNGLLHDKVLTALRGEAP